MQSLQRRFTNGCALAVMVITSLVGTSLAGTFLLASPAGAISRGLDHEGFGIELDRVCNIAERQFGGAADLNNFDTDEELYQYLKDIVRVITGFESRLKALKVVNPTDAKILKDLLSLMAKERLFINKMATLAKAKKYDQVRNQLAAQGDKFTEAETAISVRLLDSGLPGCSVLAQPDIDPDSPDFPTESTVPSTPTTVPAAVVIDPALAQEIARFFPAVAGYSYVLYSTEQEKQAQDGIANSKILMAITGRTVIGPDSRVFGDLALLKARPGVLTAAFKQDFVALVAGSKAKVEKLPTIGTFAEIYSFSDGEFDKIVVFQGDFILQFLTRATVNRKASKDFATLLVTQIDATPATPAPTTIPPTTLPGSPTTTTLVPAVTAPTTTPPPTTTRAPGSV